MEDSNFSSQREEFKLLTLWTLLQTYGGQPQNTHYLNGEVATYYYVISASKNLVFSTHVQIRPSAMCLSYSKKAHVEKTLAKENVFPHIQNSILDKLLHDLGWTTVNCELQLFSPLSFIITKVFLKSGEVTATVSGKFSLPPSIPEGFPVYSLRGCSQTAANLYTLTVSMSVFPQAESVCHLYLNSNATFSVHAIISMWWYILPSSNT